MSTGRSQLNVTLKKDTPWRLNSVIVHQVILDFLARTALQDTKEHRDLILELVCHEELHRSSAILPASLLSQVTAVSVSASLMSLDLPATDVLLTHSICLPETLKVAIAVGVLESLPFATLLPSAVQRWISTMFEELKTTSTSQQMMSVLLSLLLPDLQSVEMLFALTVSTRLVVRLSTGSYLSNSEETRSPLMVET